MRQHYEDQDEISALQNRFTGYLLVALKRRKRDYINKRNRLESRELLTDFQNDLFSDESICNVMDKVPSFIQVEDSDLMKAISHLSAKERYILFARVLMECEYAELAEHLNLRYSNVSAAYHRIIKKLRKELQGGRNEF